MIKIMGLSSYFARCPITTAWYQSILKYLLIAALLAIGLSPVWALGFLTSYLLLGWRQHMVNLQSFALWLENPQSRMPDGNGEWNDVLALLYALRRHEARLHEEISINMNQFQSMMYHFPDSVVLMDKSSTIEWFNPAAQRDFSLRHPHDLKLRFVHLVRTPELTEIIQMQSSSSADIAMNGRFLEVRLFNFDDERMILTAHDITEHRRTDSLRRDFIANASHELRTPLTVIHGFLEQLSEHPDIPTCIQQQQIAMMMRQSTRMGLLISDMLTLSRLDADIEPSWQWINMSILLQQAVDSAQALSGGQHHIDYQADEEPLWGIASDVQIAVDNILANAVYYSGKGTHIHIRWGIRNNIQPTLTISDNGCGVPLQHLAQLTDRFYRLAKNQQGTGLGLAIVQSIARRHHADLNIQSHCTPHPQHGFTLTLIFPQNPKNHSEKQKASGSI